MRESLCLAQKGLWGEPGGARAGGAPGELQERSGSASSLPPPSLEADVASPVPAHEGQGRRQARGPAFPHVRSPPRWRVCARSLEDSAGGRARLAAERTPHRLLRHWPHQDADLGLGNGPCLTGS